MKFGRLYKLVLESNNNKDDEYLDAVKRGDMETAQRMVDDAAKVTGFSDKVFRQDTEKFNTFIPRAESQMRNARSAFGYVFTHKPVTQIAGGSEPTAFYIKDGKFFDRDSYGSGSWEQYSVTKAYHDAFKRAIISIKELRDSLISRGYAGLDTFERGFGRIRVVFPTKDASKNIKLANPVTRDDNGQVIPLSQRFDSTKDDIRY